MHMTTDPARFGDATVATMASGASKCFLVGLAALLLSAGTSFAQCPPNLSPSFSGGGNLWGSTAPQVNQYFQQKVDVNGGFACNLTLQSGTVSGALTWTVSPTFPGIVTSLAIPLVGSIGFTVASSGTPSAVPLTTNTPVTIASISLLAGNWDIYGNVAFSAAGTTTSTKFTAAISQTNNTLPTGNVNEGVASLPVAFTAGLTPELPTGSIHLNLTAPASIYLVGSATFAVSTMSAYGIITAVQTP
jgi:hypothetical protein